MKDKGLERILMVIFGMGGITLLIIASVRPMLPSEIMMVTSVGSFSLLVVLIRALSLRFLRARESVKKVPAEQGS